MIPAMATAMQTRVGIVGAGPAGLTLALLLQRQGIESVILELRDREYVEHRVRAGVLEQNTVDLLRDLGVAERLDREGLEHHGIFLRQPSGTHYLPMSDLTGRAITVYGQQEVVKDLIAAWLERGGELLFEVSDVAVQELESDAPRITFTHDGERQELRCEYIAGCDGFHGICRPAIPAGVLTELEYTYPFAWLGILAEAPPATDELIYARHPHGFALYSMRAPTVSRLYLQVPADEQLVGWSDDRLWEELETRLGDVNRGPILDRGITPMRSFVASPMQHGRLFLCGDAAHIVPPTGAKGLNLAVNDARLLAAALADGSAEQYTERALRRVWRAQDFSGYMTQLLHDLGGGDFQRALQRSRIDYVARSEAAARSLAENYVGLPAAPDF
jgi:p-hydroxybenzoate 3-monooxygenase